MTLAVDLAVGLGTLGLEAAFEVGPGEVLALLGPNGAGKTTVLRSIAGLQRIDRGRIVLDGTTFDDPSTGTFVPAEHRPAGMMFQDHLLFPHLSVLDNVAFGPRARGVPRAVADETARRWIERVGLVAATASRPAELSGGQAQRAALARALATDPGMLLLDEPLASLDASTRTTVRRDLRAHLADFSGPVVLVTHDPLDALALADAVVVLEHGTVTQQGALAEVTARPRTPYVAELLGVNLLRGSGTDREVHLDGGGPVVKVADRVDGATLLLVRPRSIVLQVDRPESSARNRWHCAVAGFDLLGDRVRVHLSGPIELVAEVTPAAVAELDLVEGATLWASLKATDITVYPV